MRSAIKSNAWNSTFEEICMKWKEAKPGWKRMVKQAALRILRLSMAGVGPDTCV